MRKQQEDNNNLSKRATRSQTRQNKNLINLETSMLQKKTVRKNESVDNKVSNIKVQNKESEGKNKQKIEDKIIKIEDENKLEEPDIIKPSNKKKNSKTVIQKSKEQEIEVKQEIIEETKNLIKLKYHLKIPLEGFVKGTLLSLFPDLKFNMMKEKKIYVCEISLSDQNILNQILNEVLRYKCKFNVTVNENEVPLPGATQQNIETEKIKETEVKPSQILGNKLLLDDNEISKLPNIKVESDNKDDTINSAIENPKFDDINNNLNQNIVKTENNTEIKLPFDIFVKSNQENNDKYQENKENNNIIKEEMIDDSDRLEGVREVTIEGIPEDINLDKLKEIFFIFGDITNMELLKQENKAFIKYKLCSSAYKAFTKMKKTSNNPRGLKVYLSSKLFRSGIEVYKFKNTEEGRVVYLTFKPESVPEIEELKKSLKRFGHIGKVFRRKGKNIIYVEFSNEASARDLVKDFRNKKYNWSSNNDLIVVNYVFLKKSNKEIQNEKEDIVFNAYQNSFNEINVNNLENNIIEQNQINQTNTLLNIDYNHYWEVHFDDNYKRNYYYNPFLNESVWELPEGSKISPVQYSNYNYDTEQMKSEIVKANELAEEERNDSYYDDEAWDESDLMEKLVWDRMKAQQLKDWMKRPARQQVEDTRRDTAYIEGNYDYNIWYDKYLTDRKEEREKIPAMHKCNPTLDTGYTKADLQEKEGGAYFCMYFAKGCCAEGVNCRYYHRVPTKQDAEKIENLRDVFGRSRFATHRNDMGGVGTFTKECRTLYVSDIKMIDTANPVKEMVRVIYENFSPWGEIEDINYIPTKGICFIRYAHRCFAEFAKEAMMDQSLIGEEVLGVKWAYDDPNPMSKKRMEKENENRFLSSYQKKRENLDLKNKGKKLGKDFNNQNYYNFYNNVNNPYLENSNTINYSSGYGNDDIGNNDVDMYQRQVQDMTNNCVKLSETLKMIDENFNNPKQ